MEAVLSVAPGFEPMHAALVVMLMLGPMRSDTVEGRPSLDAVTDLRGADPLEGSGVSPAQLTPASRPRGAGHPGPDALQ